MIISDYPQIPLPEENIISLFESNKKVLPFHESSLSIKATLGGNEKYSTTDANFITTSASYLIINEGSRCSGIINSEKSVESMSIFFSKNFVSKTVRVLLTPSDELLEGNIFSLNTKISFFEQLYAHDNFVTPVLLKLRAAIRRKFFDKEWLNEQFVSLFENMLMMNRTVLEKIKKLPPIKLSTKAEIYKRVHKGRDFIDSNFTENISIKNVSDEACLSNYHFIRSFKIIFGIPPGQYIIGKRLELAMELLRFTKKNVTEICYETGFSSLGTFSWMFRKRFGIYPESLKQSYRVFLQKLSSIKISNI